MPLMTARAGLWAAVAAYTVPAMESSVAIVEELCIERMPMQRIRSSVFMGSWDWPFSICEGVAVVECGCIAAGLQQHFK